jgi:hypothetical protein
VGKVLLSVLPGFIIQRVLLGETMRRGVRALMQYGTR